MNNRENLPKWLMRCLCWEWRGVREGVFYRDGVDRKKNKKEKPGGPPPPIEVVFFLDPR